MALTLKKYYKKQLKELISVNLPDLLFVKSTQKNKSEQLISPSTQASALNAHMDSIADESDICSLWKLAKKIGLEVLEQKWEFQGKFTNYNMPALLSTFMKWVLLDLHTMTSEDGETYQVNIIIKATSQFVSQCIKTVRQTNYHLQKDQPMRAALETPLNVGVVLYIYHATRSKTHVNFLSDLNKSTNYKKVSNIKKDLHKLF